MKKLFSILILICVLCAALGVVSVSAEGIEYPVNPMLTPFNNEIIASWVNPAGLLKAELYSVDDYTDTLIYDDFSVKENEAVEYKISNLESGQHYLFRIKFIYLSGDVYSVLLSEKTTASNPDGLVVLGNWVVQPGKIPFKMNIDQKVGYDDNSSIHVSVNRETKVTNERMFLRYNKSIPAGEYMVRAMIKYNDATNANAYIYGGSMAMNGTSDWVMYEQKVTLTSAKNPVFHVYIESKTKDFWVDNFEIHKIENGVELSENIADKSDTNEILNLYGAISVPATSAYPENASARIMWNTYGLANCKINIYNKETGVLAASVNSSYNSVILRDLQGGKNYDFVLKTENIGTRESADFCEVSVTPFEGGVIASDNNVNHCVKEIGYQNGILKITGVLSSGAEDESVTLTAYKSEEIAALEQAETKENGMFEFCFPLSEGEYELSLSSFDFDTETFELSVTKTEDTLEKIDNMSAELAVLLEECEENGISTDYEKIAWRIIERDSQYFREDIVYGQNLDWDNRIDYLVELFDEAKENLKSYLDGTKTPKEAVRLINGEYSMTEDYFVAQTTEGEKPVYYTGYVVAPENVEYMADLGLNYAAVDVGPEGIVTYGVAPYWTVAETSDDVFLTSPGISISGTNKISQFVWVEEGKTYTFGTSQSGIGEVGVTLDGVAGGTYTAKADKAAEFVISGISGTTVIESAFVNLGGENLLINSDFTMQDELFGKYNFTASRKKILEMKNMLKIAEEDDIAICLHLGLDKIPQVVKDDSEATSNGAVRVNPTHPRFLNASEVYLKGLLAECGESGAFHDMIIYNEPTFFANKSTYYNQAWKELLKANGKDENTAMPSDDSKNSVIYTLYMKLNDSILTDFHKTIAEYIRKYSENQFIHTKIMQYIRPFHGNSYTGFSNDYESWGEYFDVNGCDAFSLYFEKGYVPLSSEEAWYDYMRGVNRSPVINSEDHIMHDKGQSELITHNDMEKEYINATLWQGAFHGRGATAVWNYMRYPYYLYFDGGKDVYANTNMSLRPDVQYQLGKFALDINNISEEVSLFGKVKKRAAILYSPVSINYNQYGMNIITESYDNLLFMGIGADIVGEGRLDNLDDYEMLIIPGTNYVSDEVFNKVKAYADNGGELYIIGNAFRYDEAGNRKYSRSITGSNVHTRSINVNTGSLHLKDGDKANLKTMLRNAVVEKLDRSLTVVDMNENPSDFVEYSSVKAGKYTYINICNHSEETKTIKVYLNGETLGEAYEMISGTEISEEYITLAPYEVMLIRKETVCVTAELTEEADTYKAVFNISGNTKEDNILLILASYDENGVLSGVVAEEADYGENASAEKIMTLKASSSKRIICMAINKDTLMPYMDVVELKFD